MARPLRIEVEGGWYHLTARGNERKTIFRRPEDYQHFVDLLAELYERFGLRIVAYCLMPNHYHLLAILDRRGLSRAMQWLNLSYGAWFNAVHRRSGHLFQGRFHAVLIENEGAWAEEASVYLHLNPVRVSSLGLGKRVRTAERKGALPAPTPSQVKARLAVLRTYRWSSYRALVGLEKCPPWLARQPLLSRAGGAKEYRNRIEGRIRQGQSEPWSSQVRWGLVFGSQVFADRIRRQVAGSRSIGREHSSRPDLRRVMDLQAVVNAVERLKGEPCSGFRDRHGDSGRDLIWWAARRFAGIPLAALADWAGGVDYSTVSAAAGRLARRSRTDEVLRESMQRLADQLSNPKT